MIDGVKHNAMINRCLIHTLENGQKVYDKIYGHNDEQLIFRLKELGIISVHNAKTKFPSMKVKGSVSTVVKPYCDSLKVIKMRDGSYRVKI